MRRKRFLILCAAVLLVMVLGGIVKNTLLREIRADVVLPYPVTYTVLVSDVDPVTEDMFFRDMGLYLEDGTAVGTVDRVERQAAASRKEDRSDLILHVKATAAGDKTRQEGSGTFLPAKQVVFVNRFITFTGTITGIEGD